MVNLELEACLVPAAPLLEKRAKASFKYRRAELAPQLPFLTPLSLLCLSVVVLLSLHIPPLVDQMVVQRKSNQGLDRKDKLAATTKVNQALDHNLKQALHRKANQPLGHKDNLVSPILDHHLEIQMTALEPRQVAHQEVNLLLADRSLSATALSLPQLVGLLEEVRL